MEIRHISLSTDYPRYVQWWKFWRFPPPPQECLPAFGRELFALNDHICAAWIYHDKTAPIAWLEWIVSNPHVEREVRNVGLDHLIDCMCDEAKTIGVNVIFTSVKNAALINRLEKLDFKKGDDGVTQYVRRIA